MSTSAHEARKMGLLRPVADRITMNRDLLIADLVGAKAEMTLLQTAGFSTVRITSQWQPGLVSPSEGELAVLRNVEAAAKLTGVRVIVAVYHPGSRTTPLTPEAQAEFASYTAALVAAVFEQRANPASRRTAVPGSPWRR